ncbi:MAG: response regulator [Rhodobacteraceae bacterium]|nr:response regulator [Paracoccaceae bacterium]
MKQLSDWPVLSGSRLARLLPAVAVLVIGIALAVNALVQISVELDGVRAARSDSQTWNHAQFEVDFANFRLALGEADHSGDHQPSAAELAAVRTAYDILFSRIDILARDLPPPMSDETARAYRAIKDQVYGLAATIDGDDATLRAALPGMVREMASLSPEIRAFVLKRLEDTVALTDERRRALRALLIRFTLVGVVLLVFLALAVWASALAYATARRRAGESERASALLGRTIEAAGDAILMVDASGTIRQVNAAAEQIFGRPGSALTGRGLGEARLLDGIDAAEVGRLIATPPTAGSGPPRRLDGRRADGSRFAAEAIFVTDRDTAGRPILMVFVRDVSRRIEAEDTLRRARDAALRSGAAKERFLAVMSHEMRTPLNGTISALDLIDADAALAPDVRRLVRVARDSADDALAQIDEVLELVALDTGNPALRCEPYAPATLTARLLERLRPWAEARGNALNLAIAPGLDESVQVLGDPQMVGRVLRNLVGNAIKFTDDGQIDVTLALDGGWLTFAVADDGPGIPLDRQEAVFNDFETLDATYSRTTGGTGLGLGIVRKAVALMGGRLSLDSAPGRGSTFRVSVPAPPAEAPAPVPERKRGGTPDVPGGKGTGPAVLIAEDSAVNRDLLREMLTRLGCRVAEAADGRAAVALATMQRFELILMDVSMPEMDGLIATARIRADGASSGARIVAVTAHALPDDLARMRAAGLDEIEVKPVSLARLRDLLEGQPTPEPAGPDAAAALVDPASLSDLAAYLPRRDLDALIAAFAEKMTELLAQDRDALNDPEQIHRVAGIAAILGARALRDALGAAEQALRTGATSVPDARRDEIAALWASTRAALAAHRPPETRA